MKLKAYARISSILLTLLVCGCSVQKSKKDVSKFGLFYHNLTSKYNGYFNANELLTLSQESLTNQYRDNYNKILELYEYNAVENPSVAAANLDIAIKKASTLINLHRPSHWVGDSYLLIGKAQYLKQDYETAEETFKFMVQNYSKLNLSPDSKKSSSRSARPVKTKEEIKQQEEVKKEVAKEKESLKKDNEKARKVKIKTREQENKDKAKARKQQIKDRKKGIKSTPATKTAPKPVGPTAPKINESVPSPSAASKVVAKPKSKKEVEAEKALTQETSKPPSKGKHRPVLQDGQMWLAKTYIMRKNGIAAGILINQLKSDPGLYQEIKTEIPILQAYNHIRQEEFRDAIPYLREALASKDVPNKRKARIAFVLGQISNLHHEEAIAFDAFNQVLDYHPTYEMEFYAKLGSAQSGMASGKRNKAQLLDELKRMTRDEKNTDYLTSIYHTMALVNLSDGRRDLARENLVTGLAGSTDPIQKLESFYLLASMFNEDEDYLRAKKYYDSSLALMGEKDIRRIEVTRYSESLTDIAKNIGIIETQDSLLLISAMNEKDQKQWARKMLKDREKTVNVKVATTPGLSFDQSNFVKPNINIASSGAAAKSSFFAYDDKLLKKGIKDFERVWGSRKLQDNWRISQRINNNIVNNNQPAGQIPEDGSTVEDLTSILKDIPNTPELKELAHEKIRNSMYALGVLYREKLENHNKAINVLEKLLSVYPGNALEQDALYQLYLAHLQAGDQVKANEYLERLKKDFPSSKYTQAVSDPNWSANNSNKAAQLQKYYNETYDMFNSGQCQVAMDRIHQVDSLFKENPFRAKFALVEVLCTGKSQGRDAYITALKDFIARYPQSDERDRAKDILRYILGDEKAFEIDDIQKREMDPNGFEFLEEELHYVIAIVYDKQEKTLSDLKVSISDFNQKFFQNDDLKISNIFLDQEATIPIIMVRKFDNASQGKRYYKSVKANENQFISPQINHDIYVISQSNFRKLHASKATESYKDFFQLNYKE
ncbi:MAG: tetratricopeptide repeat protein [Saprospiraceae bacterium]|nr:tetratricopeptide repeat protein [Saprospiraceae bacterium]